MKKQTANEQHPKLEMAAKEIKDILIRYDIAGLVQLFTPGFNKYTMNLSPTFSVVAIDPIGRLKINQPLVDPQNEKEAKNRIADTVAMLANLRIHLGQLTMVMTQAEIAVREQFGIAPKQDPRNISKN